GLHFMEEDRMMYSARFARGFISREKTK
ncbi:hypothetical protein BSG1_09343, partial [Bacillus sp. SG-1]